MDAGGLWEKNGIRQCTVQEHANRVNIQPYLWVYLETLMLLVKT